MEHRGPGAQRRSQQTFLIGKSAVNGSMLPLRAPALAGLRDEESEADLVSYFTLAARAGGRSE